MKKTLALICALVLTLSLAACGRSTSNSETIQPALNASGSTAPSTTVATGPAATAPAVTDPPASTPAATEPTNAMPPATEPPATKPPVTEPPATKPPVTETPAAKPPVTESVVTPPAADPNNYFFNDLNYAYDIDCISIKPRYVYWENGKLVAECFVINGFSHAVYDIDVQSLAFGNADGQIASAQFGMLQNLVLGPYQYAVWTFTFDASAVQMANGDLRSLMTQASVRNRY